MYGSRLVYGFEAERRIRAAFVGCGGQAFRNLLPCFQYAPVDLVATCDVDEGRAAAFARQFGALRSYTDLATLLATEELDAVFIATGYGDDGRPPHRARAAQVPAAGAHVWMEKPPSASVAEIDTLAAASTAAGRQVAVGFMKMFSPAVSKVAEIITYPEFGEVTSFYLRDPQTMPPPAQRGDLIEMRWFLDHIVHPVSVLHRLVGPLARMYVDEGPGHDPVISVRAANGAAGTLHMPGHQSPTSPMERLEVVGEGANVVVDNTVRLTYYRPGTRGTGTFEYGRIGDYIGSDEGAPIIWDLDCYSGQPFNAHIFYQGYAQEILHFADCVLHGRPVEIGGLDDAREVMRFFEACQQPAGQVIELRPSGAST
jgi:predicted dehydrogenase